MFVLDLTTEQETPLLPMLLVSKVNESDLLFSLVEEGGEAREASNGPAALTDDCEMLAFKCCDFAIEAAIVCNAAVFFARDKLLKLIVVLFPVLDVFMGLVFVVLVDAEEDVEDDEDSCVVGDDDGDEADEEADDGDGGDELTNLPLKIKLLPPFVPTDPPPPILFPFDA